MLRILCLFILCSTYPTMAAASAHGKAAGPDTAQIHKLYLDGDFDQAIHLCEAALKETLRGSRISHSDSIFLFKHLGVMYSAKYETRELGKKYMYQLLHVEPTAKIMDMYASDMIYMIFRNIQDEYEMGRVRASGGSDLSNNGGGAGNNTSNQKPKRVREHKGFRWVPWALGGAVIVGAGVGAYLYLFNEPTSNENVVE